MFGLNLQDNITHGIIRDVAGLATSRICGFIVYSAKNANVAKVVKDEEYWEELNAISGPNWPIFCVRPIVSPHSMSSLVYRKSDDVLNFFNLKDTDRDLPCLVLFAWDDNDDLCMNAYHIDDSTIDNAHSSLRKVVSRISAAEQSILDKYKKETCAYRNASWEIDSLKAEERFRKVIKCASDFLTPVRKVINMVHV